MLLTLRTVFHSEFVSIRHAIARPSPTDCGKIERETADLLLLPISGLFAKHDGPKQHFIANANHALFLGNGQPYRISFPGDIGDESLVVEFSQEALANLLEESIGVENLRSPHLHPHCLLSPAAMLNRDQLWRHLTPSAAEPLAIEELCVSLLSASARAACKDRRREDHAQHTLTMSRRHRQVEAVKELISLTPAHTWTLSALAREVGTSPYHLARVFREEVGVPVHQYLIRTRIGKALERMRTTDLNLTAIALDTGFASHSHFTASFRSLFGFAPSKLDSRLAVLRIPA